MRRILTIFTIFAALVVPQFATAGDMDDLKAADKKIGELYRSIDPNDTEAYTNSFCDEFFWIDPEYAFPFVMSKEQLKKSKINWVSKGEYREWSEEKSIYRVVGNTGFVYQYGTEIIKLKGSSETIRNVRMSLIYLKINGKWLAHTGHVSLIPSGN